MLPEPDGAGLFSALPIRKAFRADGQGCRLNSLAAHICGFRRETCGPDAGSWPVDTLQWQNARNAAADRAYRSDFRKPLTESTGKTMSTQEKTQPKRAYHSPRRQEQAHHTRERIIQAAVRQLKEKGYANMSLDSIAREAGVASQTVYAVCGSKKGALARILESTVAEQKYDKILDSIPQMKTGEERVATMARFHSLMQHNSASGFELMRGAGVISPELAELEKDNDMMLYEKSLQSIRQMAASGMLKKGLSVEDATDLYWAYSAPGIYRRLVLVRGWSMEKYTEQMTRIFRFLLLDENEKDGGQKKDSGTEETGRA